MKKSKQKNVRFSQKSKQIIFFGSRGRRPKGAREVGHTPQSRCDSSSTLEEQLAERLGGHKVERTYCMGNNESFRFGNLFVVFRW